MKIVGIECSYGGVIIVLTQGRKSIVPECQIHVKGKLGLETIKRCQKCLSRGSENGKGNRGRNESGEHLKALRNCE